MKYIIPWRVLWGLSCGLYLLIDIAFFTIACLANFIWEFKFCKWSDLHEARSEWDAQWDGVRYKDLTPLDSFKRRYYYLVDKK